MVDKLLDPKAAAKSLGVTVEDLEQLRREKRGLLRYVKLGKKIFYRPQDVAAFSEVRSATGAVEATATKQRPNKSRVA